jgi:hypothetical protein
MKNIFDKTKEMEYSKSRGGSNKSESFLVVVDGKRFLFQNDRAKAREFYAKQSKRLKDGETSSIQFTALNKTEARREISNRSTIIKH